MNWPELRNASTWTPRAVRLHDGREVDTCSEEWRAECEARMVLNLPSKSSRHAYLAGVAKRRGEDSRASLQALVMAVWRAGRDQDETTTIGY